MTGPTVCLIVGAAKSGTTWVWRRLAQHPDVHFRSIKELHYFDALERGRLAAEIQRHAARQVALAQSIERHPFRSVPQRLVEVYDRTSWISVLERGDDPAAYMAYLVEGAEGRRVVGEATPAYSLIAEDAMARLPFLAPDVRIVYLLRDPVDRLWSHVRMIAKARAKGGDLRDAAERVLRRVLAGTEREIVLRSDYATALGKLTRAVPADRLCLAFYEEIADGGALDRIAAFLGLDAAPAPDERVNEGPPLRIRPADRDRMRAWLEPQYRAVERFVDHIPSSWGQTVTS